MKARNELPGSVIAHRDVVVFIPADGVLGILRAIELSKPRRGTLQPVKNLHPLVDRNGLGSLGRRGRHEAQTRWGPRACIDKQRSNYVGPRARCDPRGSDRIPVAYVRRASRRRSRRSNHGARHPYRHDFCTERGREVPITVTSGPTGRTSSKARTFCCRGCCE